MATRSAASVHSASRCSDVPAENRSAMRTTSAPSRSSCSSTPESCRVRERSPRRASPRSIASTRCPETAMLGMERSSSRRTWTVALALTGTTRSRTRTSLPARLKSRRCSRTWRRRLLGGVPASGRWWYVSATTARRCTRQDPNDSPGPATRRRTCCQNGRLGGNSRSLASGVIPEHWPSRPSLPTAARSGVDRLGSL